MTVKDCSAKRKRSPWALALLLGVAAWPLPGRTADATDSNDLFRLGFSTTVFTHVNENDVLGALKVWTQTIADGIDIPTDPSPVILEAPAALGAALRDGQVDLATQNSAEYLALDADLQTGPLLVPVCGGSPTEEYLLLVHREGPIREIQDLAGRNLVCLDSPRAALAPVWLDVLLGQNGLRPGAAAFGSVVRTPKASQVVQQVFFRTMDAGVVTRAGFKTACELNPQLGRDLRELAVSPPFVPQVSCFRPDFPPESRQLATVGALQVHLRPQGRQVLTVFKVDRMVELPPSCLDTARELLAAREQGSGSGPAPGASPEKVAP